MQFNAGSILFILDECHDFGIPEQEPEKEVFTMPTSKSNPVLAKTLPSQMTITPSRPNSPPKLLRADSELSLQSQNSLDSISSSISVSNKLNNRKQTTGRKSGVKCVKRVLANVGLLYKLNLVFETATTFLMIPYHYFERILDDEKRVMKSMADGNQLYLLMSLTESSSFYRNKVPIAPCKCSCV